MARPLGKRSRPALGLLDPRPRERRQVSVAVGLSVAAAVALALPLAFSAASPAAARHRARQHRRREGQLHCAGSRRPAGQGPGSALRRAAADSDCEVFDGDPLWSEPPPSWPQHLAELFVPLGPHDAACRFLEEAPFTSSARARLHSLLCRLPVNEHDVSSLLYPPACHLLTSEQFRSIFAAAGVQTPLQRMLDVGSGDGCVAAQLRPVCEELILSESSRGMARRLRRKGYTVWREDVAETASKRRAAGDGGFSVVSILNVLDRCPAPRRLLKAAHTLLEDAGQSWLLLASPLPFEASWYGWRTRWSGRPLESLGLPGEEWHADGRALLEEVLPASGFRPRAVSRVPYLLGGDELDGGRVELDDIIVLAERI